MKQFLLSLFSFFSFSVFAQINWSPSNTGIPANAFVNAFARNSNGDIFTVVNSNGQGQLLNSTNNGATWSANSTSGLPAGAWASSLFIKGTLMFIGSNGIDSSLYGSIDGGQIWMAANNGLPANSHVNAFAPRTNGDIYIVLNANGQGQLFKSTNNAASWSNVATTGLPAGGWATSIFAKNNTLFVGTGNLGSGLYMSTNDGSTWSAVNTGLPANAYVNDFCQTLNGDLYVIVNANNQGQLFKSINEGISWNSVSTTGLPAGGWAGSIFAQNNSLLIGSNGLGSFLYSASVATTSINELTNTNSIHIYPNPANGVVNISSVATIELTEVYTMQGQLVYSQQPQQKQVSLYMESAGVYFIKVTSADNTTTQKLVITH